jgi:hypothetical protein
MSRSMWCVSPVASVRPSGLSFVKLGARPVGES